MSVQLHTLTAALDRTLDLANVPDYPGALNGLQVDAGVPTVTRVAVAVDACLATIRMAHDAGAQLLVVHHGLFWGGVRPVTGPHGTRLRHLMTSGLALYSAHLPLDRHTELGNNALLARALDVESVEPFGAFEGVTIGLGGTVRGSRDALAARLAAATGVAPQVIATGPEQVRRVAVVTGGASSMLLEAADAGFDTFVTGEAPHHAYFDAEERGVNLLLGGHYATETFGVKAVGAWIEREFGVPWTFLDHPTGL